MRHFVIVFFIVVLVDLSLGITILSEPNICAEHQPYRAHT
jgi:hypothetical protein